MEEGGDRDRNERSREFIPWRMKNKRTPRKIRTEESRYSTFPWSSWYCGIQEISYGQYMLSKESREKDSSSLCPISSVYVICWVRIVVMGQYPYKRQWLLIQYKLFQSSLCYLEEFSWSFESRLEGDWTTSVLSKRRPNSEGGGLEGIRILFSEGV